MFSCEDMQNKLGNRFDLSYLPELFSLLEQMQK